MGILEYSPWMSLCQGSMLIPEPSVWVVTTRRTWRVSVRAMSKSSGKFFLISGSKRWNSWPEMEKRMVC